jgi:hypothetical protein
MKPPSAIQTFRKRGHTSVSAPFFFCAGIG